MKHIYHNNPAYSEFRLNKRDDLIDLLSHAHNYIITLNSKNSGLVGTVQFDTFKDEEFPGRRVLTFARHNDGTRILLDGSFEFADCFIDQDVGSIVVFIKLRNRHECSVLIS